MIPSGASYILPIVMLSYGVGGSSCELRNFEVRPLKTIISRGVLGARNLSMLWVKNNSQSSDFEVKESIKNDLLPYNSLNVIKTLE